MSNMPKLHPFFRLKEWIGRTVLSEAGIAPIFAVFVIVAGIFGGTYLVQQRTNVMPFAIDNVACLPHQFGMTQARCHPTKPNTEIVEKCAMIDEEKNEYRWIDTGEQPATSSLCKTKKETGTFCRGTKVILEGLNITSFDCKIV